MFSVTSLISRGVQHLLDLGRSQQPVEIHVGRRARRCLSWTSPIDELEVHPTMQETIAVNLGLLQSDLDDLLPVARHAEPSADVTRAATLLREAEATANAFRLTRLRGIDEDDGEKLGDVFAAMSKCSTARKLLHACQPMNW